MKPSRRAKNPDTPPARSATRAEREDVAEAVENLTDAEWKRLELKAKQATRIGILKDTWQDVLHEAVKLTLSGECPWYIETNSTVFKHLYWTIRRVAYDARTKLLVKDDKTDHLLPKSINPELNDDDVYWNNLPDEFIDIESDLETEQKLTRLLTYFDSDLIAKRVLICQIREYTRGETIEALMISLKEFETVRRRIKRKLIKFINISS